MNSKQGNRYIKRRMGNDLKKYLPTMELFYPKIYKGSHLFIIVQEVF
jgi:hypothetical protein